ncbi:hypothetical protein MKW94_019555 [Papaver nudicaule]|uniref:Non-structural maintenance of chromosomes element 4 n=1 Tax=Papaver nudicaule TaxID=74823 RepID=A0AA41VXU9_PAPNU|nr:hypothetical protein [Papaver nudicaule]
MDVEAKMKTRVSMKRKRSLMEVEHPEDLNSAAATEEKSTETDENIATMFEILKTRKKPEKVENVIMNRNSFAQTVENLFALSFLVKEGRAEVKVDGDGNHVVQLRNAPHTNVVESGVVQYKHFVFRIDYKDWKTMKDFVTAGDEVMPHRTPAANIGSAPHDGIDATVFW